MGCPVSERDLLLRLRAGPATGAALAQEAGLTRAAVWKRIESLRGDGVAIEARPGRGYALAQPLDLLDADAIVRGLPPGARGGLAALEVVWSTDSTNSELLRRATPAGGATVLLAERQSHGRGRRGRAWSSPLAANLYVSFARQFAGGLARLGGLSLVAGVAATEALHALGHVEVQLKWPNDLVVCGQGAGGRVLRKLGGILVEGGGEHAGPVRAVIGVGINVRMPPAGAGIDQPWTDLSALGGAAVQRNLLATTLVAHMVPALEMFDRDGLAPFLPRHAAHDALAGGPVAVHAPGGTLEGIACGIAADGALRVRIDGREATFHSGDVSVRA
jgi:BirA family transcriptional regulator, biotin operon repressor / biotin---[acetyl-CoA-carboxylase] ligase